MTSIAKLPILLADRGETLRDLGSGFRGEQARLSVWDVAIVLLAGAHPELADRTAELSDLKHKLFDL